MNWHRHENACNSYLDNRHEIQVILMELCHKNDMPERLGYRNALTSRRVVYIKTSEASGWVYSVELFLNWFSSVANCAFLTYYQMFILPCLLFFLNKPVLLTVQEQHCALFQLDFPACPLLNTPGRDAELDLHMWNGSSFSIPVS